MWLLFVVNEPTLQRQAHETRSGAVVDNVFSVDGVPSRKIVHNIVFSVRRDCSDSRPKHNPPCRVAVDGLAEG